MSFFISNDLLTSVTLTLWSWQNIQGLKSTGAQGGPPQKICLPPPEVPGVGATPALVKIEDHVFILCSVLELKFQPKRPVKRVSNNKLITNSVLTKSSFYCVDRPTTNSDLSRELTLLQNMKNTLPWKAYLIQPRSIRFRPAKVSCPIN